MNDPFGSLNPSAPGMPADASNTISPLIGEPGIPKVAEGAQTKISRKGLLAVLLPTLMVIAFIVVVIQRFTAGGTKADDGEATPHKGERE